MDPASIANALVGFQAAQQQSTLAASMMKMNAQATTSLVEMIDQAAQNANRLANVGPGIGAALDISA
ncbi:MAG TPA: hypothetical protein VHA77_05045 [Xanthobacteraceae bacterium]|nr:hypothetical protein [Xanthobacteraceae bacterium]